MKNVTVLLTKSLADELLKSVDVTGVQWIQHSFIAFEYNVVSVFQKQIEVINAPFVFTSQNAVMGFEKNAVLCDEKKFCFCLNGATQQALEKRGWKILAVAKSSDELADVIIQSNVGEVIFCCGNIRMNTIPERLKQLSIKLHEFVVYETVFTPQRIEQHFDVIVFFSPSGVESFFSSNTLKNDVVAFCIGEATAKALKQFWKGSVFTSKIPSVENLLRQVVVYSLNLAL
jgi:uroporphyrinogen-III synthase